MRVDNEVLAVGLGLPKFCTVKNMNWTGEIMHGVYDGTHYVLEDGDCYIPETLAHYEVEFLDHDPRVIGTIKETVAEPVTAPWQPIQFSRVTPLLGNSAYAVSVTPKVTEMLQENCVVAIGVSGGKDSIAAAMRLAEYLDAIGHQGPKVLIHADLGSVEWKDSLPVCERLAKQIGWELVVVKRKSGGGMIERWERRWVDNVARYSRLDRVKLILPWSTPKMRFCTSELKTAVICSELSKRYKGMDILSVTGVRHQESARRAKMPIASKLNKLTRLVSEGWNWNPIIAWSTDDVFKYIADKNGPLHEAYTKYGSSRVSCSFCIMGSIGDLNASASCPDNQDMYRRMVDLEILTGFGFQSNRWLGDVAPHLLTDATRTALLAAKELAKTREIAEARIPKHMLYSDGWPTCVPTHAEAELLAEVRLVVFGVIGVEPTFITAESIIGRYEELIAEQRAKLASNQKTS